MSSKSRSDYQYPPDIEKCMDHRLATRIFKGLEEDHSGRQCQCCGRKVGSEDDEGSCCFSNQQLSFLGPGLPLLFQFILFSILTLIFLAMIFSIFALVTNAIGGDCSNLPDCKGNLFNTLSIVNKINKDDYLSVQNYVLLAFIVVHIFVMQYVRYRARKVEEECDEMVDTPSDYAIILRRLPPLTTKKDIEDMIQQRRGFLDDEERKATDNLKIIRIILSYDMDEYIQTKDQNMKQFKEFIKDNNPDEFIPSPLPQFKETETLAIVVFERQESKDLFIYKPNICQRILQCFCEPLVPLSDYRIDDHNIAVERAPEPDDIVWENAKISVNAAILRKIMFNLFCFGLLAAGGAAQYGLARAQNNQDDERLKLIYSFGASILVAVMNKIIETVLIITSKLEKNQTLTEYNNVLMIKISFFLFLNSGVFLVAANVLANTSDYSVEGGLSYQITIVMALNAITPNLAVFFVETCNLVGRIKICLLKYDYLTLTQFEANKVYQRSYPQIPFKYGYLMKTLWLTAFYAPLVPIVVPISILGITLNYWLEKCSYGKYYSSPNMISSMVNDSAIELLQWFSLILSCGQLLVYLYFKNFNFGELPENWSIPIYISIGISVLLLLLPMNQINRKLFKLKNDDFVYPSYQDIQEKFQVTYEMTNPAEKSDRKRKRDKHLWNLLFTHPISSAPTARNHELQPLQQALLGPQPPQPQQPQFQPNFQNPNNPFHALNQNKSTQYPTLDPYYQNTSNPFYKDNRL